MREIAQNIIFETLEAYQYEYKILEKDKDKEDETEHGYPRKKHRYQFNTDVYTIVFDAETVYHCGEWVLMDEDCTIVDEGGRETPVDIKELTIDLRDYFDYWD